MTGIVEITQRYERWLAAQVPVQRDALDAKHDSMAAAPQAFLRATYYRWCELWQQLCPEIASGPHVLAVGDLHVGNFGTWRDVEGRLVWGINDADEASPLSYANDLVRLAASAFAEIDSGALGTKRRACAAALIEGYVASLRTGGRSFVLDRWPDWLGDPPSNSNERRTRFWRRLESWPAWSGKPPAAALRVIRGTLPDPSLKLRLLRRRSGLGSLGRPRVTAIGTWHGALLARDAKPVLPSAASFVAGRPAAPRVAELLAKARRPPDPFLVVRGSWLVRRIAPDIVRADFADLRAERHEAGLLQAMGAETANLHLATPRAIPAILRDLDRRGDRWLREAADRMLEALESDRRAWRRRSEAG